MKKNSRHFLVVLVLFFSQESFANENENFLSLKNDEVNLRQGPSFDYPIKLIYKKKNLPVIIIDKSENWRKISDFENNSGWIHISQLSKKKICYKYKGKFCTLQKTYYLFKTRCKT